jgi:hypothetical protein
VLFVDLFYFVNVARVKLDEIAVADIAIRVEIVVDAPEKQLAVSVNDLYPKPFDLITHFDKIAFT